MVPKDVPIIEQEPFYQYKKNLLLIYAETDELKPKMLYRWRRGHGGPNVKWDEGTTTLLFSKSGIITTPQKRKFSKFPTVVTPLSANTLKHKNHFQKLAFQDPKKKKSM